MRRLGLDIELPNARTAPRNHRGPRISVAVFETDRDIRSLGGLDQGCPCGLERSSRTLFVAGHDHGDVHVVEGADRLERPQGVEHDHIAALHVGGPRSARLTLAQSLEALKRAVGLKHRVEVPDQKKVRPIPGPASPPAGHKVSCPLERRAVKPLGLEPEVVELVGEHRPHSSNAFEIHRPAVDVHHLLEERQGLIAVLCDPTDKLLLRGIEIGGSSRRRGQPAHCCQEK